MKYLLTDEAGVYIEIWHRTEQIGTKIATNKGYFTVSSVDHYAGGVVMRCRFAGF